MDEVLKDIKNRFEKDLQNTTKTGQFDELYLKYFSKTHGLVTEIVKEIPKLTTEEKKIYGPLINELQDELKDALEDTKTAYNLHLATNIQIDPTIPQQPVKTGYLHPTTQVIREMNEFFRYHGFSIAEGPEIETAEYNFRRLNLPEGHPATDLQDSLFVYSDDILLRTHTSSVEARVLEEYSPPIRVVVSGKVYRNETTSVTNAAFFHQYQGVVVDKGITIQNLMSVLEDFHKFLYGNDTEVRFRYKYYPEVSPGLGVDMKCKFCNGTGCSVCKERGWIEVLGSGMIHYNTLQMSGIDPDVYTGYAFGIGLDRLVMQKYNIDDIRKLYGGGIVYE